MLRIVRSTSESREFIELVKLLDAELALRDGTEHSFYAQYNTIDNLKHAVVAYDNAIPCGCGAIKKFDGETAEVKRMFVLPEYRSKGIATAILLELEVWAHALSYSRTVLETGKRQPEAIALYTKNGYSPIPNYGQYVGMVNSVCFEKNLRQLT